MLGDWLTWTDAGEAKLAAPVMQLAADHKAWLHEMAKGLPEEEARECQCLEVEYFIMRTAMVCGFGRKLGEGTDHSVLGRKPVGRCRAHVHQGRTSPPVP